MHELLITHPMVDQRRIWILKEGAIGPGSVIYWMSREQRVADNWALLYALDLAAMLKVPMRVVFCLVPKFEGAGLRQYGFMLRGLKEVKQRTAALGIPFDLIHGDPAEEIANYCTENNAAVLVTEFDPLHIKRSWKDVLATRMNIPIHEVDAHNIVPCRVASSKLEFGAYTLRPKISRLLPEFLQEYPLSKVSVKGVVSKHVNPDQVLNKLAIDLSVAEIDWLVPGETSARNQLDNFIQQKLTGYVEIRNDPTLE